LSLRNTCLAGRQVFLKKGNFTCFIIKFKPSPRPGRDTKELPSLREGLGVGFIKIININ
jgi:hypothetical protein